MTDQQLRDLLEERVAGVTTSDLSGAAWLQGRRARRRTRSAVVAGTAAAAAVASLGVVALGDGDRSPRPTPPPPATTQPSPSPSPTGAEPSPAGPDARYRGAPVWVAPPSGEEAGLPRLEGTGLPPEIDLSPGLPPAQALDRAVAVLGVLPDGPLSRVVAVGADGGSYALDVTGVVGPVSDEEGNVIAALTQDGLSPQGRYVFFVQERSLEVYDFAEDAWTRIQTPPWLAEGTRWVGPDLIAVPGALGGGLDDATTYDVEGRVVETPDLPLEPPPVWSGEDEPFGPRKAGAGAVAQSHFIAGSVVLDGSSYAGLNAVVARVDEEADLLVFPASDERWKGCCPVVGWSSGDTVLLESRHADARVLAWRVGTHDLRVVSEITGWVPGQESYVASWSLGSG